MDLEDEGTESLGSCLSDGVLQRVAKGFVLPRRKTRIGTDFDSSVSLEQPPLQRFQTGLQGSLIATAVNHCFGGCQPRHSVTVTPPQAALG